MRSFPTIIAVTLFLVAASSPPGYAGVLRGDYHDPTCYQDFPGPVFEIATPSSCTATTAEQRYYTLANDTRFVSVGAFRLLGPGGTEFCSGTLIGPYTVLTAAHCMDYPDKSLHIQRPSDSPSATSIDAESVAFVLGPNTWTKIDADAAGLDATAAANVVGATETLRVVDWKTFGWNPATLANDYALVQVYDAATNGPASIPAAQLYGEGLESQQLYVPVVVGFGTRGFGTPQFSGDTAAVSGYSPLHDSVKRAFLVGDFTVSTDGTVINDYFDSIGYLHSKLLFPTNFLEGHFAAGDSGGGFFYFQPTGSPPSWAIAGVISALVPPNLYTNSSTSRVGNSVGTYTRIAPIAAAIYSALYSTPTQFYPLLSAVAGAPATLNFSLPDSGAATLYSPVVLDCDSPSAVLHLNLAASDPAVVMQVSFGSTVIGSFSGLSASLTAESIAFTPAAVGNCSAGGAGAQAVFLVQPLELSITGGAGATVELSGLSLPGLANGDFSSGTSGWNINGPTAVSIIPVARNPLPGDLNGDGLVNCADLLIVRASFGKHTGQPGFDSRADLNADGVVDIRDLAAEARLLPAGTACK